MKIGCADEDLISLIRWKKATPEVRKKLVCNQLSMVEDYVFHAFWWKRGNPELYWELQYEWLDHPYFRHGVFMEGIKRAIENKDIAEAINLFWNYIIHEKIVKDNYRLHVTLPYEIRTGNYFNKQPNK